MRLEIQYVLLETKSAPRKARLVGAKLMDLTFLRFRFQHFNRPAQLLVFFRLRLLLRLIVWSTVIVIGNGNNVIIGRHQDVRRDSGILYDLAIRCVVLGDGEYQRRSIRHFNQLLYRAFTKGLVAY